ncbi:MAG TPA: branched-chain amino acid ABC transporter permease [Gaiellaceae bacterium]|nr:branched-chain amino acid ABC transporter permease [Gaiellaceae bacterium]
MAADLPERPDARDRPRVGVDEWVAQVETRRERAGGLTGIAWRIWDALPPFGRLGLFVMPAALFPLFTGSNTLSRFGVFTLLYVLLGLGLNIVVGFAGLLDLGYVAFYGFGAYGYGVLASGHSGNHWQAEAAIPIVVLAAAVLGLLLGLPSRRLLGDYLAIVTLFFGQAFVTFVNNANYINFPHFGHVDLTGGANGLDQIDPLDFFGYRLVSTKQNFYFLLVAFVVVITALYFANESRTGRAWRALREDPLAAEAMSIPVNRLKLMAFSFGAATAGFTGAIYGAIHTGAFPGDYDIGLLITVYAVVILGGTGSLAGVVLGAIIVNCAPEILRTPDQAGWLFYGALVLALVARLRPWPRLLAVVGSLVALGFALRAIADAVWPRMTAGSGEGAGLAARVVEHWVLLPSHPEKMGNFAYVILIAAILLVTQLRGIWRTIALVPTLYLVAFVWENRLIQEVAGATRLILLGALLIALMNARPQGLMGTARVEIV